MAVRSGGALSFIKTNTFSQLALLFMGRGGNGQLLVMAT